MTQALVNNLNIIQEKAVNLADKLPKTEGMDFGKIFETKTNKFSNNQTDNYQTSNISKPITENNQTAENTDTQMSQPVQETDNTEFTANSENTVQQNDTQNLIQINNTQNTVQNNTQTEVLSDLTSDTLNDTQISTITVDENSTENEESIIVEEELNILAELIATETTIITEEPTMYKELTTLENPTTAILLQSQIQRTAQNTLENENSSNTDATLKGNNNQTLNTDNNNINAFKQFENINSKEINLTNFSPKENIHLKAETQKTSNVISENIVKELNVEVVNSQAAETESSMSDLMQNQSPQEQTARIMIQGDIKYETIASETAKNTAQVKTTDITPSKIIEQISKQLEGMFNNSKLNMVLNPGSLGKVNLQLFNTKDGLTAQFTVTTQEAKELFMKGLDGLKESLLAQGISVDSVSVKIDESETEYKFDYTEQEDSQQQAKQQQGSKKQKEEERKDFEQMMFDIENKKNV